MLNLNANNEATMWHPAGDSRRYVSSGSRNTFSARWDSHNPHVIQKEEETTDYLQLMMLALRNEERARWSAFEPGKTHLGF